MLEKILDKHSLENNQNISIKSINSLLEKFYDDFLLVDEKYKMPCELCNEKWIVKELNCKFKIYKIPFEFRDLYVRLQKISELQKQEEIYKEKIEKYYVIRNDEILFKIFFCSLIILIFFFSMNSHLKKNNHLFNLFIDKETDKIKGMKIENFNSLIVYWKDFENILKYYRIMKKYIGNEYFE